MAQGRKNDQIARSLEILNWSATKSMLECQKCDFHCVVQHLKRSGETRSSSGFAQRRVAQIRSVWSIESGEQAARQATACPFRQ
jgi:hypothetical protein